jgi:membrane dipeptidase
MTAALSNEAMQLRRFDFGLSAAEEERAAKLHHGSIIVDLVAQHAGGSSMFEEFPEELLADLYDRASRAAGMDALTEAEYWPYEMSRLGKSHLIRDWYFASGMTCGTYGIGVHDGHDPGCLKLDEANAVFADLPWLRCVTTAAQIRQAKRDGVIALYAQWQPYLPAPRDLKAIDVAHTKGLRSFMLTYNQMDHVGVGCTERVDAGLSNYGLSVVKHCNDIGMIVDVSHCGLRTTLDACSHSNKPVTANHTAAKGVYAHARGKSDDELKAIADTDGVIGVVTVPAFLTRAESPTIEHMLDHIDYIARRVGWRHVSLGTDWPHQAPLDIVATSVEAEAKTLLGFRDQDRLDYTARLRGFEDSRDLQNVTRGLVARGYREEQIQGILGENALRVFEAICG